MNNAYSAMCFAREVHGHHVRKYTGNPYADHLAEVAGIVATVADRMPAKGVGSIDDSIAVAWLHDCVEDCGVTLDYIFARFGHNVMVGVEWLTDVEVGNRATRKAAGVQRLSIAPGWVQTIKCADLISNTNSIVKHDPDFAVVFLKEKRALLDAMSQADSRIWTLATQYVATL